jgi:protein-disulfide isomerase
MTQIEKDYITTGKVKHIFMDFPMPVHIWAWKASEAAACAGDQGQLWEMHNRLFANQNALKQEDLLKHAAALGLDVAKFRECLDTGKYTATIQKEIAEGRKAGITSRPTVLLGFSESGDKVKAVRKISGDQPYAAFKAAIDEMLSSKK